MWYLCRGVTLTKDNLLKRNWRGDTNCCFRDKKETVQHLFFDCRFARFAWRIVQIAFNLNRPNTVRNIFWNRLVGLTSDLKANILVGAAALCWSIWLCRNDVVFDVKSYEKLKYPLR